MTAAEPTTEDAIAPLPQKRRASIGADGRKLSGMMGQGADKESAFGLVGQRRTSSMLLPPGGLKLDGDGKIMYNGKTAAFFHRPTGFRAGILTYLLGNGGDVSTTTGTQIISMISGDVNETFEHLAVSGKARRRHGFSVRFRSFLLKITSGAVF